MIASRRPWASIFLEFAVGRPARFNARQTPINWSSVRMERVCAHTHWKLRVLFHCAHARAFSGPRGPHAHTTQARTCARNTQAATANSEHDSPRRAPCAPRVAGNACAVHRRTRSVWPSRVASSGAAWLGLASGLVQFGVLSSFCCALLFCVVARGVKLQGVDALCFVACFVVW